jgi:hypothetical protein
MSQFLTSNELLINIKNPPKWNPKKHYFDQSIDVLDFYLEEGRKLREGITIGGYFIHPWLYWHINYFKTPIPQKNGEELIMNPPLDDNILYTIESYQEAEQANKGLALFGTRGFSKSSQIASLISWLNTIKENGVTKVIGGDKDDLAAISRLIGIGFNKVHPAFFLPQLVAEWDKNVELGIKEKDGFRLPYSHISISNADGGTSKKSEKGAGPSPIGFIIDEALHEDSLILYDGFEKPIKDVSVGDFIYGSDGNLTEVVSKINPGVVDTWKFTLSDGREVVSSGNHKWSVHHTEKGWLELTTDQIRSKYYYEKRDNRYDKTIKSIIYSLPLNSPVNYSKKDLLIDPYWLGLYLGDGSKGHSSVCSIDQEIITYCQDYAKKLGMVSTTVHPNNVPNLDFLTCNIRNKRVKGASRNNKLIDALRTYKIDEIKSIPTDYLYSSTQDRLELLQGLMDTDGSCSKDGSIEFSTSIPQLATTFEFLCKSLGIFSKRVAKESSYKKNGVKVICKTTHRFTIHTDLPIFKLKRKLDNYNNNTGKNTKKKIAYKTRVSITNIEYVGKQNVYCIGVANESKLFLTNDFIVTHNCGKFNFRKILESALPSFKTQYGAKLVHVLSGTSGNEELTADAKEVLGNPEAYDLIMMNWDRLDRSVPEEAITWSRSKKEKFSIFVPGQMSYRLEVPKIKTNLAAFLGLDHPGLASIDINTTNWLEASKYIREKLESFVKLEGKEKYRMYYPVEIADVFLTKGSNPFPTVVIDAHIRKLEDEGRTGRNVTLYRSGADLKSEFSSKKRSAVSHGGGEADAPVIVFGEIPTTPPAKFTFVSGLDDYKLEQSDTSSLGAFYVLKRRGLTIDSPCETIAASYTGRPFRHVDFHIICETMLDGWGAICCMEAIDVSFKQFLDTKHKAEQCLAPGMSFSNTAAANGYSGNSKFGIFPTKQNNDYMFDLLIDYCKEPHVIGIDDNGNEIVKYGVEYIEDIDLLKEMLSYRKGGNFDRISAFKQALAYARELDKTSVRPKEVRTKPDFFDRTVKKVKMSVFGNKRPSAF